MNKRWCELNQDYSQVSWEEAPDWIKDTVINGVQFQIDHPDSNPEDSHKNWCAEKLADGWSYGDKKDSQKKTHPCLVSYDKLPPIQKVKDSILVAIVESFK